MSGKERLIAKWGNELYDDGITNIPQCFARYGRRFVTAGEFAFIINIFSYQYGSDLPYPSQETIAENLGVSKRQVRKWIEGLEEKGLLKVYYRYNKKGRTSNKYSFKPLLNLCLAESQKQKEKAEKGIIEVEKKPQKKERTGTLGSSTEKNGKKNRGCGTLGSSTEGTSGTTTEGTSGSGTGGTLGSYEERIMNKENEPRKENQEKTPAQNESINNKYIPQRELTEDERLYIYLLDNFSNDVQSMLLSVKANSMDSEHFNLEFLKAFKSVYPQIRFTHKLTDMKTILWELIEDIESGLKVENLAGLMTYRFKTFKKAL